MSKIFIPNRALGCVSNDIPLQVRYIKSRKENLIITCVGKTFHTYGISHFGLLSVGGLHPSDITALAGDTYHVYTACDNIINAWRRGTELKHTYRGHKKNVHLILPFGVHLVTVDESSNLRVWDIKDESVTLELTFDNDNFEISTILHPSTYINKILLGSQQGALQLWNINTSKLIYSFKGWSIGVTCLEQAPAVDVVAIGLKNGQILLHNLKYDETVMEFSQDWGSVTSISFRTDGHPIMATGSAVGHIVFWNLEERKVASQLLAAHDGGVTGMICLPNEPLVVTSSPDNTLKLWIFDMTDGGARLLRLREGHSVTPTHIRFHGANGQNILSAAPDSTLRIFNTRTEQFNKSLGKASYNRKISKKRGRAVEDPLIMPPIIQFTTDTTREKEWDNIAAVHSGIPMVTTWSYDKLKMGEHKLLPERLYSKNNRGGIQATADSICLTHCGNFVLIGYSTGHVDRFNMQSGAWRDKYGEPKAHESSVRGICTDNLNQIVVTGGSDRNIKFFKFKNKGTDPLAVLNLEESIQFFRSHHESSMIAVALEDFSINVIDLDTRRVVRKFIGHAAPLTDATFSPDSRWLITSAMDCSIRTWNISSAQLVDQFRTTTACISLDMSPTGEAIVTAHVDEMGIFLWCNKSLYQHVTLKALDFDEEPTLVVLPDCQREEVIEDESDTESEPEYVSPEQLSSDLITMSGLPSSRWQNLLSIDIIRQKNKPKAPPKAPKSAPFFLPTLPSLDFKFNLSEEATDSAASKLKTVKSLLNLSDFGLLLQKSIETNDFPAIIDKLKLFGPSMIEFELKSLSPEGGGSVELMLQFLKCTEYMLKTNKNFELAQSYLSIFLKLHGSTIAAESALRNYLPNLQSCYSVAWSRLQEKLMYSICIVQNMKTQI